MNRELIATRLELIAAKAKALAMDFKNGKLWEGELSKGIADIRHELEKVSSDARTDR
jgi:hypothetical protein